MISALGEYPNRPAVLHDCDRFPDRKRSGPTAAVAAPRACHQCTVGAECPPQLKLSLYFDQQNVSVGVESLRWRGYPVSRCSRPVAPCLDTRRFTNISRISIKRSFVDVTSHVPKERAPLFTSIIERASCACRAFAGRSLSQ